MPPPPPPAARASASAGSALSSGERGSGERVSPRSEKLFMCSSTSTLPGNVGFRSGPGPGPGLGSASGVGARPTLVVSLGQQALRLGAQHSIGVGPRSGVPEPVAGQRADDARRDASPP